MISGTTLFAVITVLIRCGAFWASAFNEAVGKEHALFRIKILSHRAGGNMPGRLQTLIDLLGQFAVFFTMGRVKVIEIDHEISKVSAVFSVHVVN